MLVKRALDVTASAIGLVLLAPLFVLVAVLVALDSPGPVFFRQTRMGQGFQPFHIYKFRSMSHQVASQGPSVTVTGDARITRVGHWLRRTKIDELPQLYNVLRGDMSLVGPRPEVPVYVDLYRKGYARVLQVRPGITDPASLRFRNEAELLSAASDPEHEYRHRILPEKLRVSAEYAEHWTLRSDIVLIWRTVFGSRHQEEP